jgi:hypothetical protein
MPTSDADLDDQLRAAMKTLDDEVPSGYFEALPDLTLARLEGTTMQHGTQGNTENVSAAPPPVGEKNEDSGLHDIRNLAQSTKQRLSSKKITINPPVSDEDLIASSSAGWKAVALPQPAKMVALPELSELPSKKEVLAKEKAAAKAEKAAAKIEAVAPAVEAPAAAPARQPAFALPSAQPKKSKKGVIAIVGIGLAAAAGAAIFIGTQKKDATATKEAAPTAVAIAQPAAAPTGAVGGAGAGSAAVSADVQRAQDEVAKAEADAEKAKAELAAAQAAAPPAETKVDVPKVPTRTAKGHGTKTQVDTTPVKADETKPADKGKDTTKKDAPKTGDANPADPDFNDLLKEAGVHDPAPKKQALDKKELTGDDFKKGMFAITSKAQGCYKGTQGTATVKVSIAPSGQIASVKVTGQFATTPEGACVVSAVKGASFPAWDGHPASFTYPILLSE